WLGRQARGEAPGSARLAFVTSSERCAMTSAPQPGLPHAPEILKAIVHANDGRLDALAEVAAPGRLRLGDRLVID
ncbi:MOSC domain-containing protein, partial [Streptomyces sp. FH025]|nr:MOSC domain-containing protein [Streptomyces sp. FH025]